MQNNGIIYDEIPYESTIQNIESIQTSNIIYNNSNENNNEICINNNQKKYLKRLSELNLPNEVKNEVINLLSSVRERFHTVSDDVLCAHTISAYKGLNIPFDFHQICSLFNVDLKRSKIYDIISNTSTNKSEILEVNNSLNIIILQPHEYIERLFHQYINISGIFIDINSFNIYVKAMKKFCSVICDIDKTLIDNQPYTIASVMIYVFLQEFANVNLEKERFSQKIFSSLEGVEQQKFGKILRVVEEIYFRIKPRTIEQLTCFYNLIYSDI